MCPRGRERIPDQALSLRSNRREQAAVSLQVAVLVPCFNESKTIASVVRKFRLAMPSAAIYVYNNNSTDETVAIAKDAGAIVRSEERQGKGHVVRRMFADIQADCYVMVDGDDTYDPDAAPQAAALIREGVDFVNIARIDADISAYRRGHKLGNAMLTGIVRVFFGRQVSDMLSGYKVLSRRFVKSFPAMSRGFETETELTVHALEMRMPMAELSAPYRERPQGSVSKLRTYRDGWRILMLISRLIKEERPFAFFSMLAAVLVAIGLTLGISVVIEFLKTGLVPRLPTAVLSLGFIVLSALSMLAGIILDVVTKARQELKRLIYLSVPCR